jgi:hypothetical protein
MTAAPTEAPTEVWHDPLPTPAARAAWLFAFVLLALYAILAMPAIAENWFMYDAKGYWETGLTVREGGALYPPGEDGRFVYRYAPWFAWIWALLTYIPQELVFGLWVLALGGASVWLLLQIPRTPAGILLGLIFAPMLLRVVSQGNVHPIMLAAIVWGLHRRTGPIWIALAASLKLVPIIFAALYLVRRQYRRALWSVVLSALLWMPAVFLGLANYPTIMTGTAFPFGTLTFALAGAVLLAIFLVPDRYREVVAGLAATFASPRWIPYNPSYLQVGVPKEPQEQQEQQVADAAAAPEATDR